MGAVTKGLVHIFWVHVMYVTQVCMHTGFSGVNGNTHTHTHTHKAGLLLSLLIVSSSSPVKLKLCFPEVSSQYSAQEPFSDKPHYSTDA